jgi:hypothetical protein
MKDIKNKYGANARIDKEPDTCPICNFGISPKYFDFHVRQEYQAINIDGIIQSIWACPKQNCNSIFFADYVTMPGNGTGMHHLRKTYPKTQIGTKWPNEINQVSPQFIKIYNQSEVAENMGLNEIAGIGYRKSLEFLVKDFCISQKSEKAEAIKNSPLAQCIQENIDDKKIKECAKRAAWLGNDETHYTRKWEDKDINDLKALIRLTVHGIEAQLLSENYISEMEDPKNKK